MTSQNNEGGGAVDVVERSALAVIAREELDISIVTAKKYPRSISKFLNDARTLIRDNKEVAAECMYAKPQGGGSIVGPSIRLAEICLSGWGNIRAETMITDIGERDVTAVATVMDLERNVTIRQTSRRSVVSKGGQRYQTHTVINTALGAQSIALRSAVFRVIPKAYINILYEEARLVAVGSEKTLPERRLQAIKHFSSLGINPERVYSTMGIGGIDDIDLSMLEKLVGISTAIKDGDTSVEAAFPETPKEEPIKNGDRKPIGKKKKSRNTNLAEPPPQAPLTPEEQEQAAVDAHEAEMNRDALSRQLDKKAASESLSGGGFK